MTYWKGILMRNSSTKSSQKLYLAPQAYNSQHPTLLHLHLLHPHLHHKANPDHITTPPALNNTSLSPIHPTNKAGPATFHPSMKQTAQLRERGTEGPG